MRLRLALFLLLAPLAHAQKYAPRVTEVLVLNTAATALTRTPGRHGLLVQNLGPNAIFCGYTAAEAVVNKGIKLAANGGSLSIDVISDSQDVYCIAATADQVTTAATIVSEQL